MVTLETLSRIVSEVKATLRLSDDHLPNIDRTVRRSVRRILDYCCREDLPAPLEDVAAQMSEDILRAQESTEATGAVSSITRGDTTIKYQDPTKSGGDATDFLKDYRGQLIHFRRLNLPKG